MSTILLQSPESNGQRLHHSRTLEIGSGQAKCHWRNLRGVSRSFANSSGIRPARCKGIHAENTECPRVAGPAPMKFAQTLIALMYRRAVCKHALRYLRANGEFWANRTATVARKKRSGFREPSVNCESHPGMRCASSKHSVTADTVPPLLHPDPNAFGKTCWPFRFSD